MLPATCCLRFHVIARCLIRFFARVSFRHFLMIADAALCAIRYAATLFMLSMRIACVRAARALHARRTRRCRAIIILRYANAVDYYYYAMPR